MLAGFRRNKTSLRYFTQWGLDLPRTVTRVLRMHTTRYDIESIKVDDGPMSEKPNQSKAIDVCTRKGAAWR